MHSRFLVSLVVSATFLTFKVQAQRFPDKTFPYGESTQVEISVAVSPSNVDHLGVSFMSPGGGGPKNLGLPVFLTSNGGATWFNSNSPLEHDNWGDPVVFFDATGRVFHGSLSSSHGIQVASSTDSICAEQNSFLDS